MPRLQLLQALMTLVAFNSSSLRLRFIFLSLASLMTSLSSFLALPFWSSLFCFCLGFGFCQPYLLLWDEPIEKIGQPNSLPSSRFFPLLKIFLMLPEASLSFSQTLIYFPCYSTCCFPVHRRVCQKLLGCTTQNFQESGASTLLDYPLDFQSSSSVISIYCNDAALR